MHYITEVFKSTTLRIAYKTKKYIQKYLKTKRLVYNKTNSIKAVFTNQLAMIAVRYYIRDKLAAVKKML
jgi:hypothetical protein